MSVKTITTNVKIEEHDYEVFRILMVKRKMKIGEAIGELISKEIRNYAAMFPEIAGFPEPVYEIQNRPEAGL